MAGPQHPSYHIQMSGTGDVVITEIWKSTAVLVLKKDIAGKIYIHNQDNVLVVELKKSAGREISIGLDAGDYRIISIGTSTILESKVSLEEGKSLELGREKFKETDKIPTDLRGNLPQFLLETDVRTRDGRWRIEMFGGLAKMSPDDLNLRATFDDMYNTFYVDDYFQYQKEQGEIVSFVKTNDGGKANLLKHSIPVGIRFRYSITNWFDFSLGLTYLTGTRKSSFKNRFEVVENGGPTALYTEEFLNYTLAAKGFVPTVGIHMGKRISPSLRLEAYFTGGPLFAECLYSIEWNSEWPASGSSGDFGNLEEGLLEEKGTGTGLALQTGVKMDLDFAKHYGLFMEGGYAYQAVSTVSGPGTRSFPSHRDSWEGEWAMKQDIQIRPWGTARFLWPSNGWEIFGGTWWRARDFELDLSGFQVRIGIYYRF